MMVSFGRTGRYLMGLCVAVALAGSLGGCPKPDGDGNGTDTLAGTWAGDVSYEANILLNDQPYGQPFEKSFNVTFNDQGQPAILDLATAHGSDVAYVSTANLIDIGNSDEQTFVAPSGSGTSKRVTATVTDVSRSPTAFHMTLDVKIEFVGSGSMSGTYTVNAALQGDGTVSWASTSDLTIDSDKIALPVTGSSVGTLSRQ